MGNYRDIELWFCVDNGYLVRSTASGWASAEMPEFSVKEQLLFKIHLLKLSTDEGEDYVEYTGLAANTALSMVLASPFDSENTPDIYAKSTYAQVNVEGDWDQADMASGRFSVRMNLNTAELLTYLGASRYRSAIFEIMARPAGSVYLLGSFKWEAIIFGIVDTETFLPLIPGISFSATPISDTELSLLQDLTETVLTGSTLRVVQNNVTTTCLCESVTADTLTVVGYTFPSSPASPVLSDQTAPADPAEAAPGTVYVDVPGAATEWYVVNEGQTGYDTFLTEELASSAASAQLPPVYSDISELYFEDIPVEIPVGYPSIDEINALVASKVDTLESGTVGSLLVLSASGGIASSELPVLSSVEEGSSGIPTAEAVWSFFNSATGGAFIGTSQGAVLTPDENGELNLSGSMHFVAPDSVVSSLAGGPHTGLLWLKCSDPAESITLETSGNIHTLSGESLVLGAAETAVLYKVSTHWQVLFVDRKAHANLAFTTLDWAEVSGLSEDLSSHLLNLVHGLGSEDVSYMFKDSEGSPVFVDVDTVDANTLRIQVASDDIFAGNVSIVRRGDI